MTRTPRRSEDTRSFLSAGALVLNCPGCGSKVAANSSICSVCDYIIDGSFLSGEPAPDAPEESTDAAEDPRRAAKPPPPKRPRPAPGRSGSRPAAAAEPGGDSTNIRSMDEVVRSAPQQRAAKAAAPRPAPRRAPAPEPAASSGDPWDRSSDSDESSGGVTDPDELIRDAKELFGQLRGGDKVAFWAAAVVLISCFMPWKETAVDGDVLGLMSMGVGAFVMSILLLTAVTIRVKGSLPSVNPVVPWMGQLVVSIVCLIWCIVYIKMSSDTTMVPTPIGNSEMMNSSPSFGVYVAVLGAVATLGGTLMGLKGQSDH
ncbi:hypothetical protein A176_002219 [Myxococcus hansupus]|uniref:Uncharacterized protein n=1 Tax=Pseudomyxococcus hansupus TaxID=1297742 RepID=A0A0H4XBK6_9BACT|nr:hypothetical protein [Myxococcus hansupus]AKQ65307.1 hypothetical protein A176_002219 [Myxococcus hansupus]